MTPPETEKPQSRDPGAPGAPPSRLRELASVFLRLGFLGFGGPAAHLALLEDEVVSRRRWIDRQGFLDLIGATHLIPGPNSTEMAIHLGYLRAGFLGMLVAGACFIVPAASLTGALAWVYDEYGSLPEVAPVFEGIQPAVLAVILVAVLRLSRTAASSRARLAVAAAVTAAVLLGSPMIWTLLAGGAAGMAFLVFVERSRKRDGGRAALLVPLLPMGTPASAVAPSASAASSALFGTSAVVAPTLAGIGLVFLKVGAFLYGGGYVLVAFLEGELVEQRGWLNGQQLLDAIAAGQFTPGPILSTATFVGYLLRGWSGAAVATVAIFLPSFVFVLLLRLALPRLQRGRWKRAFLDAVNASAVGLLAVALLKLGKGALATPEGRIDLGALVIATASLTVLLRWKVHPAWIVIAGAGGGWLIHALERVG